MTLALTGRMWGTCCFFPGNFVGQSRNKLSPVEVRKEVGEGIPVEGLTLWEAYAFQHKPLYLGTNGGQIPFKPNR